MAMGIPCVENIQSSLGIINEREYTSMATNSNKYTLLMEIGRRNQHEPYAKALVAKETSEMDFIDSWVHLLIACIDPGNSNFFVLMSPRVLGQ